MRHMFPVAALMSVLGMGCAGTFQPGRSRQGLETEGYLRYQLFEYEGGQSRFVWIPSWRMTAFRATAAPDDGKTVLEFREGRLVKATNLGADRERWLGVLREHGQEWCLSWGDFVVRKEIREEMPVAGVLLAWGMPTHTRGVPTSGVKIASDSEPEREFWYLRGGRAHVVRFKEGAVSEIETVDPL